MTFFLLLVIVGLLIWIGVRLKPHGAAAWECFIVNVTGDIDETERTPNERGRQGWELVMLWSPPREDGEWWVARPFAFCAKAGAFS